mgnify:CR=1 FL=1
MTASTPDDGTPPRPTTGNTYTSPAGRTPTPSWAPSTVDNPTPSRVSNNRAGVNETRNGTGSGSDDVGVTADDGADQGPVPTPFVARTRNVYGVPFVRPDTTQLKAPVVEHWAPPGDADTV